MSSTCGTCETLHIGKLPHGGDTITIPIRAKENGIHVLTYWFLGAEYVLRFAGGESMQMVLPCPFNEKCTIEFEITKPNGDLYYTSEIFIQFPKLIDNCVGGDYNRFTLEICPGFDLTCDSTCEDILEDCFTENC